MAGFYIREVIAKSKSSGDARVSFGRGLNIIQGRSETGKTCVVKCIDFIFGSESEPFNKDTKYDSVTMTVAPYASDGKIILSRNIGEKRVKVESTVPGIDSGIYKTKGVKNSLNDVWLKLIGIEPGTKVVSNAIFESKRLTWRTLLRIFYLDEDRIDGIDSILDPNISRPTEKTLLLSSLLYLITGKTFIETDAKEKKEIKKARLKAMSDYVSKKIDSANEHQKELETKLQEYESADIEKWSVKVAEALQETREKIDLATKKGNEILSSILKVREREAGCNVLLERYSFLRTQLKSDIDRLSFIAEGEEAYKEVPMFVTCPYCEGVIPPQKRESYLDAAKAEIGRIAAQLVGLEQTKKDVEERRSEIQKELESLTRQKTALEDKINNELRPLETNLMNVVSSYKSYVRLSNEISLIKAYTDDFQNDLLAWKDEEQENDGTKYHPKDYFGDGFISTMTEYANTILRECSYSGLQNARFDPSTFDIEVNGEDKGLSHGKGYRAYLNTVIIMMLRKYLAEHAEYNPRLFIIDTPLHGFDEGVDDHMPDSMRAGLYRYFMNHQDEGQLIIIENLDHIPDLEYEKAGVMVETFWKSDEQGKRYGFLNGVK